MDRWHFPLMRIAQDDDHGCGIAAVATVCGVTYERARFEFFPQRQEFDDDESLHVGGDGMVRVVERLGFSAEWSRTYKSARCPTILFFEWQPRRSWSGRHAVVWDPFAKAYIDPGPDRWLTHDYHNLWKRSGHSVLRVTGRRYDAAPQRNQK